jgi:hypothetical protein
LVPVGAGRKFDPDAAVPVETAFPKRSSHAASAVDAHQNRE